MEPLDDIIRQYGAEGVETSFKVGGRTYRVFAFPTPGRGGDEVRWNLYSVEDGRSEPLRGLTFGLARGVREAMEEVVEAAREHAQSSRPRDEKGRGKRPLSFRPSALD
jgi:hypothetical protein